MFDSELQNTERSQRVSDLIQGFTPKKGTTTPKRKDYPPMIEQTREPVEPVAPVEVTPSEPSPKKRAHRLPNVEQKKNSIPKPSIASLSDADDKPRTAKYQDILTPNTKADLEIESMKRQIEEAKMALEKNKFASEGNHTFYHSQIDYFDFSRRGHFSGFVTSGRSNVIIDANNRTKSGRGRGINFGGRIQNR